jgi:hypothetical protein
MNRTVSVKPTAELGSRCDSCRLWYRFLHPASGGKALCPMCSEIETSNRSAQGELIYVRGELDG